MNKKRLGLYIFLIAIVITGLIFIISKKNSPKFSGKEKTHHLIVISIDALNAQDFNTIKNMPNFKFILENGSYAREVTNIYPSLTYPSHTTLITGVYPDHHGIYTNEFCQPGVKEQEWRWDVKHIKVPTLFDLAKKQDMTVGAFFWPVMANAKIDYNCSEIWPTKGENQILLSLKNGTPIFLLDTEFRYSKLRDGKKQPNLDNYTTESVSYMIRSRKPNLVLVHLNELDHVRHKHGVNSIEAKEALKRMDERIGKFIQAAKQGKIFEDSTFIILGDHGFLDVSYKICLNVAFRKANLITTDSQGNVTDWKAYSNYCDGSTQIHLKDPNDEKTLKIVKNILQYLINNNLGVERIYTKEECAKKGVTGDFSLMVEAKKGYYFNNEWTGNKVTRKILTSEYEENGYYYNVATHGFDPLKENYKTIFMAYGKGIKKGIIINNIKLVDECPTFASLLGIDMKNMDGRTLEEIIA